MTSKQRAYLMSLASNLNPIFQVGKSSLTPELTAAIGESFNNNELIKIGVLKNCFDDPRAIAEMVAERTHSQVVQVIGKKIVLYGVYERSRYPSPYGRHAHTDDMRRQHLCRRQRSGRYQRGNLDDDVLFRPRHEADLCHRRSRRSYRRCQGLWQIQLRRSRHEQDRRIVVRGVYLSCGRGHNPALVLPLIRTTDGIFY